MRIRKASISDLEQLQKVFVASIDGLASDHYSEEQRRVWKTTIEDKERWLNNIQRQYFMVVEIDEQVIGFASLDAGYVDFLYVHPSHARKGVASQLMAALEAQATNNGIGELTSDVSEAARPFFERLHFLCVHKNTIEIAGVVLHNHRMRKSLHHG